jgi:CRISPR-associated protein Cas1
MIDPAMGKNAHDKLAMADGGLRCGQALPVMPLLDELLADETLALAWTRVRANGGGPGADGIDLDEFGRNAFTRIRAFFDNIPHAELLDKLAVLLPDASLQPLLRAWLSVPVQTAEGCQRMQKGVAQGSPLSPLLANLYLDGFDEAIAADAERRLVRYADDFVILCRDVASAEIALEDAAIWLAGAGLEINFDKTRMATFAQGVSFLGVRFTAESQWAEDPASEVWLLPPKLQRHRRASGAPVPARTSPSPLPAHPPAPLQRGRLDHARVPHPEWQAERRVDYDEAAEPLLRTLYVAEPGAYLRRDGGRIVAMKDGGELLAVPLEKLDQVLVADEGAVSFAVLRALLERGAGLVVQGDAGEALGACLGLVDSRVELRRTQHRRAEDADFCLTMARTVVAGKIANSRLLLRRHYRFQPGGESPADTALRELQARALQAPEIDVLRGLEGAAARAYFEAFAGLLPDQWQFPGRRRQPPTDPVNALLSCGYGVLFQNLLTLVAQRGLDPHLGCLHAVRDGHPALISDLMEEFRALVVDAVVLKLLAQHDVRPHDFTGRGPGQPCRINLQLRKVYLRELEAKLQSRIVHPATGREGDYRRAMRMQVGHWIQVLEGQAAVYRPFMPR